MTALIPLRTQPKEFHELCVSPAGVTIKLCFDPVIIQLREGDHWMDKEIVKFLGVKQNEYREWCLEAEVI